MWWAVKTQSRASGGITLLTQLQDRRFSFYLNRPCEASGTISADAGANIDLGLRPGIDEATVLYDGVPQETVFSCTGVDVTSSGNDTRVAVRWQGIMCYLSDAIVLGRRSAYSGTTVPWTWLNTFQTRTGASVYAITQGTQTGTPPTRSRLIEQDATLLDEIINLSETSDGFDFNIDAARKYNEWHTQRGSSIGLTLEYGVNVVAYSYAENAGPGEIVTDVRVVGPAGASGATATDAAAQTTYGRREASLPYMTELENATVTDSQLQNYADAAIVQRAAPLIIPNVTLRKNHPSVEWGNYWLGDTIRFKAAVGAFTSIDAEYRLVAIHADVDADENTTVTLDLNKAAS